MKKFYRILSKVLIVMLVTIIPMAVFSQEKKEEKGTRANAAPSNSYWSVMLYGGGQQFNGDLAKNKWFNPLEDWRWDIGLKFTKQFTRVLGVRIDLGYGRFHGGVDNKFVDVKFIKQSFTSSAFNADLHLTVNWLNWILGSKPERLFSSYLIFGVGHDEAWGVKHDNNLDQDCAWLGDKDHKDAGNLGNTSGIGGRNVELTAVGGIGFDFNIDKHWSINPEIILKWKDGDILDMQTGGAKQIINDIYSQFNVGLAYKFGYTGGNLKEMEKKYGLVKYETTPPVLTEKGDSVAVTIKGTFPPKYFAQKAAMYFEPELKYAGGSYPLKPMHIKGEKVQGDGTLIKYKEGGTFTYTTVFPYKPEMNTSELVVAPIIYEAKEKTYAKKDEIKTKAKFIALPDRKLVPGVIYTPTRILNDQTTLIADHGYKKEVIQSKTGVIYFKKNMYDLDFKHGINKTNDAKDLLTSLKDFIQQGWKVKSIDMNGWASPEGEETFNAGLSENRSKSGNKWMIDTYQEWVKEANKDNKDKKAVKAAVEAAGKDVNITLAHHGPDWNGFLKTVQNSKVKDKDKILNVINSAGPNEKKEQEIRNMILIYPEIEEDLLPPFRRCEITANLYEPRKSDEDLLKLGQDDPKKLRVDELLYAATLTNDKQIKTVIYENAAKQYPDNWKALNGAGVANINNNKFNKANEYLLKAAHANPNNGIIENNIGVVAAKQKDYVKAETHFKKAQQLGENENYNLGTLLIPKGDYPKALNLLANAKCSYNLGLAQLVSGNNAAAETTLKCAPQTPETFYLLAIVGARTNNTKMLYEYLMKACQDPDLKSQAKGDREFYSYANTPEFQNIVK